MASTSRLVERRSVICSMSGVSQSSGFCVVRGGEGVELAVGVVLGVMVTGVEAEVEGVGVGGARGVDRLRT